MITVKSFVFSPFGENTYVLSDETKECVLIDPGCYDGNERKMLSNYIKQNDLKPVRLLNTHGHLDHVFGNQFVFEMYGLLPELCREELPILAAYPEVASRYGVPNAQASPFPEKYIEDGEILSFGASRMKAMWAPGHSPGSLCYYFEEDGIVFVGDVLFYGSIGRVDLQGGDYETLIHSIETQLMTLPDETVVYCGHSQKTTIGRERVMNPFLNRR